MSRPRGRHPPAPEELEDVNAYVGRFTCLQCGRRFRRLVQRGSESAHRYCDRCRAARARLAGGQMPTYRLVR